MSAPRSMIARVLAGLAGAVAFLLAFLAGMLVVPLLSQWSVAGRAVAVLGLAGAVVGVWLLVGRRRHSRAADPDADSDRVS